MACATELLRRGSPLLCSISSLFSPFPIEVAHQQRAGHRLTAAYETVQSLCFGEKNILDHHAHALKSRSAELSKQKAELLRLEEETDAAAIVSYQTDVSILCIHRACSSNHHSLPRQSSLIGSPASPTSPRFGLARLLPRRRRASSTSHPGTILKLSHDPFHHAGLCSRNAFPPPGANTAPR